MQWLVLQVSDKRAADPHSRAGRRNYDFAVKVFAAGDCVFLLDWILADAFEDKIAILIRDVAADQYVALVVVYREPAMIVAISFVALTVLALAMRGIDDRAGHFDAGLKNFQPMLVVNMLPE
jgi:hypothetical protein